MKQGINLIQIFGEFIVASSQELVNGAIWEIMPGKGGENFKYALKYPSQ